MAREATRVAAGNIALPNANVVQGTYTADELGGINTIQVELL